MYKGKIFEVTKDKALLENGSQVQRDVVHHSGGVAVIPVTENNEILMVRQYRYPHHKAMLEIPAGKIERGEKALRLRQTGAAGGNSSLPSYLAKFLTKRPARSFCLLFPLGSICIGVAGVQDGRINAGQLYRGCP